MSIPAPKPRLLVVSATYAAEANRKKLEALATSFDLLCATCSEHTSYGLVSRVDPERPPAGYRLIGLPVVGKPESTTRYWLRGLGGVFRHFPADVVLVESEPWAWIRWQAWFWKLVWRPRARFGEYAAENLERRSLKGWVLDKFYRAAVATADFVACCNRAGGDLYRRRGLAADRLLIAPQLGWTPPSSSRLTAKSALPCAAKRDFRRERFSSVSAGGWSRARAFGTCWTPSDRSAPADLGSPCA